MTSKPLFDRRLCLVVLGLIKPLSPSRQPLRRAQRPSPNSRNDLRLSFLPLEKLRRVAGKSNLYCAGYIKYQRFATNAEIVGAEGEPEQRTFAEGDIVYLDWGSQQGIKEGQPFQIIRPKGDVKGVFREKKGFLGTYVRELGQLEVFKVCEHTSVAQITFSCEMVLLGDLACPDSRSRITARTHRRQFDRFAEPTGKPVGRLMMARDSREMVTQNDVVYIDLGSKINSLPATTSLSIDRSATGGITTVDAEEDARGRATGFQSDRYRGGGFSSQSQRAKDSTASVNVPGRYRYRPITTREVKEPSSSRCRERSLARWL